MCGACVSPRLLAQYESVYWPVYRSHAATGTFRLCQVTLLVSSLQSVDAIFDYSEVQCALFLSQYLGNALTLCDVSVVVYESGVVFFI
jgi:hypothetical protein